MADLTLESPYISEKLKAEKFRLMQLAKKQTFQKGNISKNFIESKLVWNKFINAKKQNKWDTSFYLIHIYIRLVLEFKLHRRREANYQKVSAEALANLKQVENEVNTCLYNIRYQILHKLKVEDAQLKAHERAEKEKERKEEERIRKLKEEEERRLAEERKKAFEDQTASSIAANKILTEGDTTPRLDPPAYPDLNAAASLPSVSSTNVTVVQPDVMPPSINTTSVPKPDAAPPSLGTPPPKVQKPPSFKHFRVRGDGNCCFRSIVQGINQGGLSDSQEYSKAMELRKLTTKELLKYKNSEMMETGLTVEQVITMDPQSKHDSFNDYLRAMSQSAYAGEVELWLIAKTLGVRIAVWKPEKGSFKHLATYGQGATETIHLLWTQSAYGESGNHYDLLLVSDY